MPSRSSNRLPPNGDRPSQRWRGVTPKTGRKQYNLSFLGWQAPSCIKLDRVALHLLEKLDDRRMCLNKLLCRSPVGLRVLPIGIGNVVRILAGGLWNNPPHMVHR